MSLIIQALTPAVFSAYGTVLNFNSTDQTLFQVQMVEDESVGWQIAVMKVVNRTLSQVSCHPTTLETFEPLSGVCILVVAAPQTPQQLTAFILDAPVCINKGVWHCLLTLSEQALVKVTENKIVTSETKLLPVTLTPVLAE